MIPCHLIAASVGFMPLYINVDVERHCHGGDDHGSLPTGQLVMMQVPVVAAAAAAAGMKSYSASSAET